MPPGDLLQGKFLGPAPEPGKVCGWVGWGGKACSTCESACLTSSSWSFGGCGLGDPLWETLFFSCGQEDTHFAPLWALRTVCWGKTVRVRGSQCCWSFHFSSVAQSCLTLCDPMDCSTPGFPVHHQLLEFIQTHVHWVGDAIQPSHPLSSPSPPTFNLSQHQGLFKWVSSLHQVTKILASASVLPMNIQDWFPLGWTSWIRYALSPSHWLSASSGSILVLVVTSLSAASYQDLFSEEDLILAICMHIYPGICISNPDTVEWKALASVK